MLPFLLLLIFLIPKGSLYADYYYGPNSTQANITFNAYLETYEFPFIKKDLRALIVDQLLTSIGPLKLKKPSGSYYPRFQYEIIKDEKIFLKRKIYYKFSGLMSIKKKAKKLPLYLHTNPFFAYFKGLSTCRDEKKYYPFWYYWNPFKVGCNLKKGTDYQVINPLIKRIPNDSPAIPKYELLEPNLKIAAFFGPALTGSDWTKHKIDSAVDVFYKFINGIEKLGFTKDFLNINKKHITGSYTKIYNGKSIKIEIYAGDTHALSNKSLIFRNKFLDAIQNKTIVFYTGHAGNGHNLNLNLIAKRLDKKVTLDPNKYQIFHFSTCLSYSYYAKMYFDKKFGYNHSRDKLDFITYAGGETRFKKMANNLLVHLKAINRYYQDGSKESYQSILKKAQHGKALISIVRPHLDTKNEYFSMADDLEANSWWAYPLYNLFN